MMFDIGSITKEFVRIYIEEDYHPLVYKFCITCMHLVPVVKEAKDRLRIKYSNYGTLNLPQSLLLSSGKCCIFLLLLLFLKHFGIML